MREMLRYLVLVIFLADGAEGGAGVCAKNVIFATEVTRQFNQDTGRYVSETKISFSIGLQETVCFEVESENGGTTDPDIDGRTYYFAFENVQSIFTYKNAYTFSEGEPKVKCLCDCPGIENHCSPGRESCDEDNNADSNCFNYYSDDHPTGGCGIASILGSGEVCCSVSIEPANTNKYTAFEIATPVTRSIFRIEKNSPFESRQFASDLGSGAPHFDGKLQISFVNPGNINPIPDGWYFGRVGDDVAYTNVKVNALSDWDVNKLGWYKYQNNQYSISQTAVKNAFDSVVLNCDESELNVDFYTDANMTYAKSLEKFYAATLSKATRNDDERSLTVSYHRFSKINVIITISGAKKVVQEFSMPSFLDFYGAAMFDMHSNRFLNVTIISAKGTLYGSMKVGSQIAANFDLTIVSDGNLLSNYSNYIQITQWCNESMVADLCFHAGDNKEVCKTIECREEQLMDFELPMTAIDYEKAVKPNIFGFSTWSKYLNPLEWFNGMDNWQEGVIMLISILMYLILICLLIKIVRCFKCGMKLCSCFGKLCCCCCKKKKKKEEDYDEYDESLKLGTIRTVRRDRHQREDSRNRTRGTVGGSIRYVGTSIRGAGTTIKSSFKRKSRESKRMLKKLGTQRYIMLQRMLNTMSVEDLSAIRDGVDADGRMPTPARDDTRVCIDIDSNECIDMHSMHNNHHRQGTNKSNRSTRSTKSARTHRDRPRDRRLDIGAFSPNSSTRSHRHKRPHHPHVDPSKPPKYSREDPHKIRSPRHSSPEDYPTERGSIDFRGSPGQSSDHGRGPSKRGGKSRRVNDRSSSYTDTSSYDDRSDTTSDYDSRPRRHKRTRAVRTDSSEVFSSHDDQPPKPQSEEQLQS